MFVCLCCLFVFGLCFVVFVCFCLLLGCVVFVCCVCFVVCVVLFCLVCVVVCFVKQTRSAERNFDHKRQSYREPTLL